VLPSLGENDVVLATTASLFPGVDASGAESPLAARVKGDAKMAGVLAKAVADVRQALATAIEIKVDGTTYRLTPRMCGQARAEAEERLDPDTGAPLLHNTARRVFINAVVRELTRQRLRDPDLRAEQAAELAGDPAVRGVLDVLWPEVAPRQFLTRLYQEPGRLDLTGDERAAIARDTPAPWTGRGPRGVRPPRSRLSRRGWLPMPATRSFLSGSRTR
jgi:DNA helicase IV